MSRCRMNMEAAKVATPGLVVVDATVNEILLVSKNDEAPLRDLVDTIH